MDGAETPKKAVKKSLNRANDCCQMCKCSFNVKYGTGKSGHTSTQNLYKPQIVMVAMVKFWPRCLRTLVLYSLIPEFVQANSVTSKQTCLQ